MGIDYFTFYIVYGNLNYILKSLEDWNWDNE